MTDDRLSLDGIHELLAARRRRYVLYCLYLYANPMQLRDVAGQVAEWEYGMPKDELLDERMRIYNSLHHAHIPKLADAHVVTYNRSEDMVELAHNAFQLRPYLDQAADMDLDVSDISIL